MEDGPIAVSDNSPEAAHRALTPVQADDGHFNTLVGPRSRESTSR